MIPAVSQSTTLPAALPDELEALGDLGLELWLTKVEQFVTEHSWSELERLLEQHAPRLVAASYQGGLWQPDAGARETAWMLFRERLAWCRRLGVPVLVVAGDLSPLPSGGDVAELVARWRQAGDLAAAYDIRLAIECRSDAALANNLLSLGTLIREADHPSVGWCLDTFHWFVGPSQTEDLAAMPADRLYHVHVSDLLDRPRELARDADRVLPGDGMVPLEGVIDWLWEIEYAGAVSVELFHAIFWELPPVQVIKAAEAALERTCRR